MIARAGSDDEDAFGSEQKHHGSRDRALIQGFDRAVEVGSLLLECANQRGIGRRGDAVCLGGTVDGAIACLRASDSKLRNYRNRRSRAHTRSGSKSRSKPRFFC